MPPLRPGAHRGCRYAWPRPTSRRSCAAAGARAALQRHQHAGRLCIAPRHIGTSAEVLTEALRRRAQAALGVPVWDSYGATELAPIAAQCGHGRLHPLEDRAIFEVADAQRRALPPGQIGKQLLLTVFGRRTQPLIRYALGDRVRLLPGPCTCGRALQRLAVVAGRREESLVLPATRGAQPVVIHPNQLHAVLERLLAGLWQVRQTDRPGGPLLRGLLVGEPPAPVLDEVRGAVAALLEAQGAAAVDLRVEPLAAAPRGRSGKARLIVRERPS
jgi:phenylacetate-coenzyme A ligase PaaK-like adenylate-forming protein